jgi:hypothetical protein
MGVHDPFDDEVMGRVTFDEGHKEWQFVVTIAGSEVSGTINPKDCRLHLEEQGLDEISVCVRCVRDNEPHIRQYIADEMFEGWWSNWYDDEIDTVTTREGFREAIALSGISVLEDRRASLCYNDGGLFGGHAIVLSVGADGVFDSPPSLWG